MTPPAKRALSVESRERATNVKGVSATSAGAPRFIESRTQTWFGRDDYLQISIDMSIQSEFRVCGQVDEWIFSARAENIPFATQLFHFSRHVSPLSSARSLEMEASMSAPARSIHASTPNDAAPFLRCVSRGSPRWTRPGSPGGISICADSAVGAFPRPRRVAFVY